MRPALFEADFPSRAARLICDFQVKVGPLMVDTFDDLMVYFLEAELICLAAEIL